MSGSNNILKKIGQGLRFGAYHAILLAGAIVFSAPFVWLIGTSFKSPDELYPPSWFPPMPANVVTSPYFGANANELPIQPVDVNDETWEAYLEKGRETVRGKLLTIKDTLPNFIQPYVEEPYLTDFILGSFFRRMPKELWTSGLNDFSSWINSEINSEIVINAFDAIYRRVALGELIVKTWDAETVKVGDAETLKWELHSDCAKFVPRLEYFNRKGIEVHYDFSKGDHFVVETIADCNISADEFKRLRLSLHGDKSWYSIHAIIDIGGKRFKSVEPIYLQYNQWQDCLWQVYSHEDKSIMMKSWYTIKEIGNSPETPEGKLRLKLEIRKTSYPIVLARKAWGNYREVLREVPIIKYTYNSLLLVLMNIIGQIFSASFVAYAFARLRWPGRDYYFILILVTLMIPAQVTLVPQFLIWKSFGLYNTLVPLWAGSFFGNAFFIFLLRQFMLSIPKDLEDSALIDGCGYLRIYRHIILPLIKPALATVAIFTFLWVWNDFMGPLIFLTDQEKYPLSLGLFALHALMIWLARFELMMAAAVLMTLPVIALFFFAQRQFIQGITLTGMKG